MALRDLSFIKYIEAAFRHKLFKDPSATYFNYLGYNLQYKSEGGKKGIFEYSRKVLPLAYTNEFADTDEGNLQMARAVIERLDKEGKPLDLFIEPSQIPQEYDLIAVDAKAQSEQAPLVPAEPAAAGGEAPSTMLGGIPSVSTPQGGRVIYNVPQTKPPAETTETPLEKRVPGLKTTPETGLDYEGKPYEVPSTLKSAGRTLASDTQIGIKKGITRAGTNLSGMLGGVGRGFGGILGGIGSGGIRLLGGAGGALSNIGTQMTRSPIIGISGRFLLIFLIGFLLIGTLAAFAPVPAPGTQPTPSPQPPVTAVASCPVPGGTISTPSYEAGRASGRNNGHCDPASYPYVCNCGTSGRRAKAIDVPTSGQDVLLPKIEGQNVSWSLIFGPYGVDPGEGGGSGYTFEATLGSDRWYLDMLHLGSTVLTAGQNYPSGTDVAKSVGVHVHMTMGKNNTRRPTSPGMNPNTTDCDSGWLSSDFMCR